MRSCSKRYTRKVDLVFHQKQKGHNDAEIDAFQADLRDKEEWVNLRNWTKQKFNGQLFDVIMSDPLYPDTGFNLGYDTMTDEEIMSVPIEMVQDRGFVFLWSTNAKNKGYKIVTKVNWLKSDNGEDLISVLGRVFQHCKEECIVGMKGDMAYLETRFNFYKIKNAFIDLRILGSQKPKKIYEMNEEFCPGGHFLDVYARLINRRPGWVGFGLDTQEIKNLVLK